MQSRDSIALFTGSFDPPTLGHLDLITRASRLFTYVQIAVGEARGKTPLFSWDERQALLVGACQSLPNVRVEAFTGLAAKYGERIGATVLLRGLRSGADLDYETTMARMNQALAPGLETVFLLTSPALSHVSSSLAKEIARHGGDIRLLVPPNVATALASKTPVSN